MEVHHHTHAEHAHNGTSRKKFTHYLWEFLMLFFAVFCGFLAENMREHYVEHQREKQFIRSLIDDIEADTTALNELVQSRILREAKLDSLSSLLNSDSADRKTREIYFFASSMFRVAFYQFTPNEGTMQQLKNSGGLRLIRKLLVADSIIKYDVAVRALFRLDQLEQDVINIHREMAPKIFNGLALSKFLDQDNNPLRVDYSPPLTPGYKNFLNEFNYRLNSLKNVNRGYRREARRLLTQAANLIIILQKEYRLK